MHCLGRDATSDYEKINAESGDTKTIDEGTGESKISVLKGLDTIHLLIKLLKLISTYHTWYSISHMTLMTRKQRAN